MEIGNRFLSLEALVVISTYQEAFGFESIPFNFALIEKISFVGILLHNINFVCALSEFVEPPP
ncbi:MAG: hypothetical protein KR126chlam3_01694 [Chlamydiae bacterium]|nr:hypothetical protein [Chlamydiota bacterium]